MIQEELQVVEDWVQPLVQRLRPVERRRLMLTLARGLRRRQSQRIASQRDPDGKPYEKRKPRPGRRGPMFRRIRQVKYLRTVATPGSAQVGYRGRTARIARIHQEGLQQRITPGGPLVQYPQRRLVGWSDEDRLWVLDEAQQYLAERT